VHRRQFGPARAHRTVFWLPLKSYNQANYFSERRHNPPRDLLGLVKNAVRTLIHERLTW